MQANSNIIFQISDAGNNTVAVGAGVNIPYNQWSHVAGTLDGSTGNIKLYVNGALASQTNTTIRPLGSLLANNDPGIGIGNLHENVGGGFPFYGDIDEIALYDRALSANEIQAIYNAGASNQFTFVWTNAPT